jgi:hypothetical protein
MISDLAEVLESAKTWPEEDQEALAEAAHEIEAHRIGVYVMTEDERAAIEEGLDQDRRGDVASDSEVNRFWNRLSA